MADEGDNSIELKGSEDARTKATNFGSSSIKLHPVKTTREEDFLAHKVTGTVEWFDVVLGYGFIKRNDTKKAIFVHHSTISRSESFRAVRSLGAGEEVEFYVVLGSEGKPKAVDVTGPNGASVLGSTYAPRNWGMCAPVTSSDYIPWNWGT